MNAPHLIAVDVGNSRTKFALFAAAARSSDGDALPVPVHCGAVEREQEIPWNEVRTQVARHERDPVQGIVAGANPAGVQRVLGGWPADFSVPRVLERPDELPLRTAVDAPDRVGIDRLLNCVAVNVIRPADRPAIIVDCGTATTVDLVSADGVFQGGAILPGFELAARSLHQYTALLPMIPIEELAAESHLPLGRNTRAALRSGLFWGQLGAIKELIVQLETAIPTESQPVVLLTGGGAGLLEPYLDGVSHQPHLALRGLAIVANTDGAL